MPFKSEAQRKYLWANEPEIARDWTDTYGSGIQAAEGGRIGYQRGGPPGGGDPGMRGTGRDYGSSYGPGRDTGWSPGVGGTQHIPTHRPAPRPDPTPTPDRFPGGGIRNINYGGINLPKGPSTFANLKDFAKAIWAGPTDDTNDTEDKRSDLQKTISTIANPESLLGKAATAVDPNIASDVYGGLTRQEYLDSINKAEGGRIGYQMGNMVGAEIEGAEIEGAEMEGAMMQSQEVIKELYDALIAQGLSPREAMEKIKQIIASTQTQEPESPMMGEEFPGQEFGRTPAAFGGIMDTYTGRRKYGLGDFVGSIFSPVKKALKKVKKLASSKFGKIALGYLAGAGLAGWGAGNMQGFLNPGTFAGNIGKSWTRFAPQILKRAPETALEGSWKVTPEAMKTSTLGTNWMAPQNIAKYADVEKMDFIPKVAQTLEKSKSLIPGVSNKVLAGVAGPSIAAGLYTAAQPPEELGGEVTGEYDADLQKWKDYYAGLNAEYSVNPERLVAQGGRIGRQEGGLMNLGGMEKDYRNDGGFVPLGGEEKADDVPARLSKNEFVFTADAVRNAGGGDIDQGAQVMENVMKNLEGGGQISEESQGQGAQEMFETSERLSEVI